MKTLFLFSALLVGIGATSAQAGYMVQDVSDSEVLRVQCLANGLCAETEDKQLLDQCSTQQGLPEKCIRNVSRAENRVAH